MPASGTDTLEWPVQHAALTVANHSPTLLSTGKSSAAGVSASAGAGVVGSTPAPSAPGPLEGPHLDQRPSRRDLRPHRLRAAPAAGFGPVRGRLRGRPHRSRDDHDPGGKPGGRRAPAHPRGAQRLGRLRGHGDHRHRRGHRLRLHLPAAPASGGQRGRVPPTASGQRSPTRTRSPTTWCPVSSSSPRP